MRGCQGAAEPSAPNPGEVLNFELDVDGSGFDFFIRRTCAARVAQWRNG